MMKNFLNLMLLGSLLLTSCSSNDDDGPVTDGNILGKWNYAKTITILNNGEPSTIDYASDEPGCDKDYQEFLSGGALQEVIFFHNASNVCAEDTASGTWTKSGNTLVIDGDSYEILVLSGSELRYKSVVATGGSTLQVTQVFTRVPNQ